MELLLMTVTDSRPAKAYFIFINSVMLSVLLPHLLCPAAF